MKQNALICKMTSWSWIFIVQTPRLGFYTCKKGEVLSTKLKW